MAETDDAAPLSVAAAAAAIARPMSRVQTFVNRYAPWISLGLGIVAHFLFRHGVEFAPKALGLLGLAWTLPALVARVLPDPVSGTAVPRCSATETTRRRTRSGPGRTARSCTARPPRMARRWFQWFRDGAAVGPPMVTRIEGGRSAGYRSATSKNAPAPGHWRVDMCNEADQLIGRVRFEVLR